MIKKVFAAFLVLFFLFPVAAFAKSGEAQKIVVLPQDEVIERDYYAAGEIVEISGTVIGDVYAAGGQVLVDGVIEGDLLVAGGSVIITGEVTQDVRAAGGQISISGSIGRNATLASGNIDLTDAASVGGNMLVLGGNVNIGAPVGGDIKAGVGALTIMNSVSGDVDAAVGSFRLSSDASIDGDISYTSEEDITVSESATVSGTVNKHDVPEINTPKMDEEFKSFIAGANMFAFLMSIITSLVVGFLMIKFLPNYTKNAASIVTEKFLASLAVGFLGLIVTPIIIVILFATIVGIPLSLLLLGVFVIYLYIVRIFAMVAIGTKVSSWLRLKTNNYLLFTIGLAVYYILSLVPIIGWLAKLVVLIASFGAALKNEKATWRKALEAKIY
jgi:hypothetical protein